MKNIIIVLLLIISSTAHSAVDIMVNNICFNGLKHISLDTALFNLPFKTGSIINENIIANSIKKLFATGYFENVEISNSVDGTVTVTVKERPVINTIKFSGNKIITSLVIQEILNAKNIRNGALLNDYSIFEVKQELEATYYNFGNFNATVKIISTSLKRNCVDLQIIFFEGKTAKIGRIDIFGNCDFSQKQLLKQFKSCNPTRWYNITFNKQYQKQKLLYDLEMLREFYLNRGYAKFHIDDTEINFNTSKENVYLSVFLTEGSRYFFNSVIIRGNVLDHIPEIQKYFSIPSGEIYNSTRIQKIEESIRYMLGKYGYIQPNISIEYDFNDQDKTIKLYIYIDVGNCFYIREIRFEGNEITKDFVIRREIQQMEQSPLNYVNILKDQERLRKLSYFKQVHARITYLPDLLNQVDLIYNVEERNTGNLNASVGIGTESGINMQVGMRQENLLGTGNSIFITANRNRHQTNIDISVLKKYFGTKNNSISGKIFYSNFLNYKTDLSNYNIKNHGIGINYSYFITEYKTYCIGLDYISRNLSEITPQIVVWRYLNSIGIDPLSLIKDQHLNKNISFCVSDLILISGWIFNNLDHIYFPKSGSNFNIVGHVTLPRSDNKYYKVIIDGSHYLSLDKNSQWILMNSAYIAYAAGLDKKIKNPFYDNFCIGGIGTIRGFRLNSVGPKAAYYDCNDSDVNYTTCAIKNSQDTVGGNAAFFLRNELNLPISLFINKTEYFDKTRISLFLDVGTVWDTYWKNTEITRAAGILDYSIFGHIRISSGISLKWVSPIGPIIFSYSKLIKQYPGDIEEPFQFSIGKMW